MLNDANRDVIAAAVAKAEAGTSGEIVCVLARQVSPYAETPLLWASVAALLVPAIALAFGVEPPQLGGAWVAVHSSAGEAARHASLAAYAVAQAALFCGVCAVTALPALRTRLTLPFVKTGRVRDAALAQLAAAELAAGPSRAAVVIFAADAEHRVEVLATAAAHAAVGQAVWDEAINLLLAAMKARDPTAGFVSAVALCGDALARAFPQSAPDPNAIADRPLEL